MQAVAAIDTVELFPELSAELLGVLKQLPRAAWGKATACAEWAVKDVVAHLLGGNLSRLSFGRDGLVHPAPQPFPKEFAAQVEFINQRNADWVNAARGISAPLLVEFLELTDPQLYVYFSSLAPLAPSRVAVSWAGESQSPNWFDIAREYTEKWLHQQHIREAVGQPVLAERPWLYPVLDTFMRALPYTYRPVTAPEGTAVTVQILGEAGGEWSLLRQQGQWRLFSGSATQASATVQLDQDTAWRLFTKGINPAAAQLQITGDESFGQVVRQMVALMA